jgi:hypothetical protein
VSAAPKTASSRGPSQPGARMRAYLPGCTERKIGMFASVAT